MKNKNFKIKKLFSSVFVLFFYLIISANCGNFKTHNVDKNVAHQVCKKAKQNDKIKMDNEYVGRYKNTIDVNNQFYILQYKGNENQDDSINLLDEKFRDMTYTNNEILISTKKKIFTSDNKDVKKQKNESSESKLKKTHIVEKINKKELPSSKNHKKLLNSKTAKTEIQKKILNDNIKTKDQKEDLDQEAYVRKKNISREKFSKTLKINEHEFPDSDEDVLDEGFAVTAGQINTIKQKKKYRVDSSLIEKLKNSRPFEQKSRKLKFRECKDVLDLNVYAAYIDPDHLKPSQYMIDKILVDYFTKVERSTNWIINEILFNYLHLPETRPYQAILEKRGLQVPFCKNFGQVAHNSNIIIFKSDRISFSVYDIEKRNLFYLEGLMFDYRYGYYTDLALSPNNQTFVFISDHNEPNPRKYTITSDFTFPRILNICEFNDGTINFKNKIDGFLGKVHCITPSNEIVYHKLCHNDRLELHKAKLDTFFNQMIFEFPPFTKRWNQKNDFKCISGNKRDLIACIFEGNLLFILKSKFGHKPETVLKKECDGHVDFIKFNHDDTQLIILNNIKKEISYCDTNTGIFQRTSIHSDIEYPFLSKFYRYLIYKELKSAIIGIFDLKNPENNVIYGNKTVYENQKKTHTHRDGRTEVIFDRPFLMNYKKIYYHHILFTSSELLILFDTNKGYFEIRKNTLT